MSATEQQTNMEKELEKYGLTIEDLGEPQAEDPKWLKQWREGKRLNTFDQSLKEQTLREKQKDKERKHESENDMDITSHSLNTSNVNSKDDSQTETNSATATEIKTDSDSKQDSGTEKESVLDSLIDEESDDELEPEADPDPLDELFAEHPRKDDTHTYRGFYLENAVVKIIDKKSKKGGKGMKSKIVNEALKIVFKEKGWMD